MDLLVADLEKRLADHDLRLVLTPAAKALIGREGTRPAVRGTPAEARHPAPAREPAGAGAAGRSLQAGQHDHRGCRSRRRHDRRAPARRARRWSPRRASGATRVPAASRSAPGIRPSLMDLPPAEPRDGSQGAAQLGASGVAPRPGTDATEATHATDARWAASEPRLVAALRDEILASPEQRITFARFMERALTEPGLGYYATSELRPTRGGRLPDRAGAAPLLRALPRPLPGRRLGAGRLARPLRGPRARRGPGYARGDGAGRPGGRRLRPGRAAWRGSRWTCLPARMCRPSGRRRGRQRVPRCAAGPSARRRRRPARSLRHLARRLVRGDARRALEPPTWPRTWRRTG